MQNPSIFRLVTRLKLQSFYRHMFDITPISRDIYSIFGDQGKQTTSNDKRIRLRNFSRFVFL